MIGTVIGNYRVVEKLGEGGMGTVYKAVDLMLEREVALKILRPELAGQPELAERFRTEAIALARLNHPHIATLYGLAREGDQLVMIMEFVRGETLERLVARLGPLAPGIATSWCGQVLDAMGYAHRQGVVHRDLKPANLMVTEEGVVKVTDFGIARVLGSAHQTRHGHVIGTASYMAPEQIRGQEVDARTDIYALGIVLYELVTGQTPFRAADEFTIMAAQVTDPPVPPRQVVTGGLPEWLDAAILKALAKLPADRFQTATEFKRGLDTGLKTLGDDIGPLPAIVLTSVDRAAVGQDAVAETRVADGPEVGAEAASGIKSTRLAEPVGRTRVASSPAGSSAGSVAAQQAVTSGVSARLASLTWRHYAGFAAILVALGAPVATWLALRRPEPASPPAQSATNAERPSPDTPSAPAGGNVGLPPAEPRSAQPIGVGPIVADRRTPVPPRTVMPDEQPGGVKPIGADREAPVPPREVEPTPAAPAASSPEAPSPFVSFEGLQMLVKDESKDVVLKLASDHMTVTNEEDGAVLLTIAYAKMDSAVYEETRQSETKRSGFGGALRGALSKGGRLFGAGKHYLTVKAGGQTIVLHLGRGYEDPIAAFEERSGIKVKR